MNLKISENTLQKTILALQKGFDEGDFEVDKNGSLYNPDMIEFYGGFIDRDIKKQVNAFAKKHNIKKIK